MPYGGGSSAGGGGHSAKGRNRDREIYGVFAESDSDFSDEDGSHQGFKGASGFNRGTGRPGKGQGAKAKPVVTRFVKGGTLNPDQSDPGGGGDGRADSSKKMTAWAEDDAAGSDMDVISDDDLIDRILADDKVAYASERAVSQRFEDAVEDDEMALLRATRAAKKVDAHMRSRAKVERRDAGLGYNPDVGLLPNQMDKMYGKGLKMLQKMGYTGGGLGREGTGVVAPIEVKARHGQQGLQNEGEMCSTNRDLIEKMHGKSRGAVRPEVSYSNGWQTRGSSGRLPAGDESPGHTTASSELDDLIGQLSEKVLWFDEMARNNFAHMQKAEQSLLEVEQGIASLELSISSKSHMLTDCDAAAARIKAACDAADRALAALKGVPDDQCCVALLGKLLASLGHELEKDSEVYGMLGADEIACSYARRCFDITFTGWDVAKNRLCGIELLRCCAEHLGGRVGRTDMNFHVRSTVDPPLLAYFSNIWSVADTDVGLRCYEAWHAALAPFDMPGQSLTGRLKEAVICRLLECLSGGGSAHVSHIVVHPWLSIFGDDELRRLIFAFTEMVRTLLSAEAIANADKCQRVLNAWKVLLDHHTAATVMGHLCAGLTCALKEVDINPRQQDTRVVEAVVRWEGYLGVDRLSDVLCKDLMPRWLNLLRSWLALPSANFEEIIVWYGGWKSLFPASLLRGTLLESYFKDALREMDRASREVLNEPDGGSPRSNGGAGGGHTEPIISRVDKLGSSHGITLIKRPGMLCDAGQVYVFGAVSVCFSDDCVFLLKKGEMVPVSLDELLRVAQ